MGSILESTDVKNKLEDLSGVVIKPGENPYNALINACNNDPVESHSLSLIIPFRSPSQNPHRERVQSSLYFC